MSKIKEVKTAAILYARYSPRRKGESMSAEAQLNQCRAYCAFHDLKVIDAFTDELISGKSADNRPGFQDAIAKTCKFKAVLVVYSLSRFARSTPDAITYCDRLNKAGAHLASLKEQIDTTTPVGRFFYRTMASLNELEREQIGERTRDAMLDYQDRQMMRMSNLVPFGKSIDPANPLGLVDNPSELKVIERICELHRAGKSMGAITKTLWLEGTVGRRSPIYRHKRKHRPENIIGSTTGMMHHAVITKILKRAGM